MARRSEETLAENLAARTVKDPLTGCVNWVGHINTDGYGTLCSKGRRARAHRVAYELARGPIPPGLVIDHLCRNRACCNPEHLEPVTSRVNILRGEGASARLARATHCVNGHPFSPENTYIRRDRGRERVCRTCKHDEQRSRRRDAEDHSAPSPRCSWPVLSRYFPQRPCGRRTVDGKHCAQHAGMAAKVDAANKVALEKFLSPQPKDPSR